MSSSIEIATFSLSDGVSAQDFVALDDRLQSWSYLHRPGLQRRTTARDGDEWLVVTLWAQRTDATDLFTFVDDEVPRAWTEVIKRESWQRQVFDLLA